MRYRKLDINGDYTVDPGSAFLVNTPQAVAQAVATRLKLLAGEWFLDTTEGLNADRIVGNRTQQTRDLEVQQRILTTQGVKSITQYASRVDSPARGFTVAAVIDTIYGQATLQTTLG